MSDVQVKGPKRTSGIWFVASPAPQISVAAFGISLGLFLAISYTLCVVFDLLFPAQAMYQTWLKLCPDLLG